MTRTAFEKTGFVPAFMFGFNHSSRTFRFRPTTAASPRVRSGPGVLPEEGRPVAECPGRLRLPSSDEWIVSFRPRSSTGGFTISAES